MTQFHRGRINLQNKISLYFFIFFILSITHVHATRISTLPAPGIKSLGNHLTDTDNNFKELYRLIFLGESGFIGVSGNIITSGVISSEFIDSNIVRRNELDDEIDTLYSEIDRKQDAPTPGDGSLFLSDNGWRAIPGGVDWDLNDDSDIDDGFIPPGIARIANLPVAGTDYLTPAAISAAITSGITGKQDASTAATDSELAAGLAGKQNADADLTTFAGITPAANIISILTAADYPAIRTLLGLRPGTDIYSISATDTLLSGKQNADSDLTTFASITPSANVISLLSAANYAAARTLLDLEAGVDFYSITAADTLLGNKQNLDADLTDLADGSLTGSKIGTGIVADYITTGTLPDAVIPSAITRDTELTAGLATKQNTDVDLDDLADGSLTGSKVGTGISATNVTTGTLPDAVIPAAIARDSEVTAAVAGKLNTPTGTPDGTKFLRDDNVWAVVGGAGGGDMLTTTYDTNTDGIINDTAISSNIARTSAIPDLASPAPIGATVPNAITGTTITSTGGTDGTRGMWLSGSNTTVPNTTTYPNGVYNHATNGVVLRSGGTDYPVSTLGGGGSTSVSVNGTSVTNPNFTSDGEVTVSATGSTVTNNIKSGVITADKIAGAALITGSETYTTTNDTTLMTSAAIDKLIDYRCNVKLASAGFTIANYLNPISSPFAVTEAGYTVSGDVFDAGTTPTVTVSLNGGTYEAATVTGSSSPWTWSRLLTLVSGNNTIDVRITASDNDVVNLPQVAGNFSAPDLPTGTFTTPASSGSWVQSTTYTTAAGTAQDDQGVTSVQWKVGSGTYAAATGTTSWTIPSATLVEGANTLYVLITGSPSSETTEISTVLNVDTINPIGVADVDSTHDGVTAFVSAITVTETNINVITYSATNATPASGSCTYSGGKWITPNLTPTGTSNVTVTFNIIDLSGRTASGTDLTQVFSYNSGADLLFEWHAENVDVTAGTPSGSSVGDTTATATGSPTLDGTDPLDGTYSILINAASERYGFTWANDILKFDAGTIDCYVKIHTWGNGATVMNLADDANNRIGFFISTSTNNHIYSQHLAGGTTRSTVSTVALSDDTWYRVRYKWDSVAHSGNYTSLQIDEETPNYVTSALGIFNGDGSSTLNLGEINGVGCEYRLDAIKIYSTWQE